MMSLLKKHNKKIQKASGVSPGAWEGFKKRRRLLIKISLVSGGLTFASLAIVGTQLFYPFHVLIGVSIYVLSFIPFGYRIYLSRDTWKKYKAYGLVGSFVKKERRRMLLALCLLILVAVLLWVRPLDAKPFAGMSDAQISTIVVDDLYSAVTAMDYLETTGNDLLSLLQSVDSDTNGTEDVDILFNEFLIAVAYSETLTERHRYFAAIPYRLWDERVTSFLVSYSLYSKKYELVHRIMTEVANDDHKLKALNHFYESIGRANIYNEMVMRFYAPKTSIRITAGYWYARLFIGDSQRDDISFSLLRNKAYGSYAYLKSNIGKAIVQAPGVVIQNTEQEMFDAWFPIQKGVATAMGRATISTRGKGGLITAEDISLMKQQMLPGDIMLQRRNWHVSNVGIPGFWTHSALYSGDLETMDAYFASEFPYQGYVSMSEYIETELPAAFASLVSPDYVGITPSVIEAIEPGVVFQTLTKSADADFVVVLRPMLTKKDIMLSLVKAFANTGKPYDFNFDFDTRDALVCSELVYDAYFERLPEKNGLSMQTSLINGRKIVSPFDIAKKYVAEKDSLEKQLEFVYFIMSSEKTGETTVGTEKDFVGSLEWSKFSFLQNASD